MIRKKDFIVLLLISIGLANVGEWIYFIALNMMILNDGGNPLTVGVLYLIRPIADLLTNIFFSAYADKLPKRKAMLSLGLLRAVLVSLLLFNQQLSFIYVVVFLLQVCSSMYEPLSLGYVTRLIPKHRLKKFNSWSSLVNSGGFLIGPAIAGVLLALGTPLLAIFANALLLLLATVMLLGLPNDRPQAAAVISFMEENRQALLFFKEIFCCASIHCRLLFAGFFAEYFGSRLGFSGSRFFKRNLTNERQSIWFDGQSFRCRFFDWFNCQ